MTSRGDDQAAQPARCQRRPPHLVEEVVRTDSEPEHRHPEHHVAIDGDAVVTQRVAHEGAPPRCAGCRPPRAPCATATSESPRNQLPDAVLRAAWRSGWECPRSRQPRKTSSSASDPMPPARSISASWISDRSVDRGEPGASRGRCPRRCRGVAAPSSSTPAAPVGPSVPTARPDRCDGNPRAPRPPPRPGHPGSIVWSDGCPGRRRTVADPRAPRHGHPDPPSSYRSARPAPGPTRRR